MTWMSLGVLTLLSAGFAKLSTAGLNRLLATPRSKRTQVLVEVPQLLSIPLYPLVLTLSLGNRTTSLGQFHWQSLNLWEAGLVALGCLGFVFLVRSTLKFQLYQPPRCEISSETCILDFRTKFPGPATASGDAAAAEHWHHALVGQKPMRGIALLPGNEQFTLEVSTKTYTLPRLPVEWDGLSILHLADTHFLGGVKRTYFERVCEEANGLKPDVILFTGDLLDDLSTLDWLPSTFGRLRAPLGKYFILGNHDWLVGAERIRAELQRQGWIDLASQCIELRSPEKTRPLILAGDETPWMGTHPDLSQVDPSHFRILLSHTPDNITWATEQGIDLMLAGHTHGGQIRLPILGPVYSPSRFGCRYASGVFWIDPTLMYVSRGISGREPVRYNCVPELTKLVLKCSIPS
ncbi:metallophosphoesterase [Schlesneria sp. T3-172]|uniref:metallophosphoesterase n=1 Tax=Schlesneria sphaerica TaxID=3373610 RepID=UPI0037CBC432